MIFRIDKREYDSDRVPILLYWKTQKAKQNFVQEVVNIKTFKQHTNIEGFSYIKVEDGIVSPDNTVSIKFLSREERGSFLRQIYDLGDDCNMYIACPDDIPYNVISAWINSSLKDMGIKPDTSIEITD